MQKVDGDPAPGSVEGGLGITLADVALDESGSTLMEDWMKALAPGEEVFWQDPEEEAVIERILAVNAEGISPEEYVVLREEWDHLLEHHKIELANQAGVAFRRRWQGEGSPGQHLTISTIEANEPRGQLAAAQEQAHTAEARAQEIERRAGELRTELDKAHQDADQARKALAEQVTAAQAERDLARKEASAAREEAARLAGQLTAYQEQNAALLARIQPAADQDKPKGRK